MGQSASGKAAWRWARTCAPPAVRGCAGNSGGGQRPRQCRADLALAQVEAFPDALPGPVAAMAVGGGADAAASDAAGDGALEESPQTAGGQAQPPDFVGEPDAEGPPAAAACACGCCKRSAGRGRSFAGDCSRRSRQIAVPNQRADRLAVRTRRQLEPLSDRVPFVVAAAKPSLLAHVAPCPAKIADCTGAEKCGVEAGYDEPLGSGKRGAGSPTRRLRRGASCRIPGVILIRSSDDNSATFGRKCDQRREEVRSRGSSAGRCC